MNTWLERYWAKTMHRFSLSFIREMKRIGFSTRQLRVFHVLREGMTITMEPTPHITYKDKTWNYLPDFFDWLDFIADGFDW